MKEIQEKVTSFHCKLNAAVMKTSMLAQLQANSFQTF